MSVEPVAPILYDGFTLPSWATPCESEQFCEVDGLPIVATVELVVKPTGYKVRRDTRTRYKEQMCAICILWEMRNRGEITFKKADELTQELQKQAVEVVKAEKRYTTPFKQYKSKHRGEE